MTYSDVFVLLGAPASLMACVPLLYSGAIVLEKHMRQEAQADLSAYILAAETTPITLREAAINVFTATFGKSQFSSVNIRSSLYVSLLLAAGMIILSLVLYGFFPFLFVGCVFLVPFALVFGFISTAKTRFLLKFADSMRLSIIIAIFADFLAAWLLSSLAFQSWSVLSNLVASIESGTGYDFSLEFAGFQNTVIDFLLSNNLFVYLLNFVSGHFDSSHYSTLDVQFRFLGTVICACMTFAVTIWLSAVVAALFAIRLMVPFRRILTWGLAVHQHPLRAVAVAGITLLVSGSIVFNFVLHVLS